MGTRPRGRPRAFNDRTDQNTVQALDRALALLAHLAQSPGLTLSQLSEETGQAVATVYRALVTLQGHGMVELDEADQVWHVGPGAFRIGSAFLRRMKLVERARTPMEALMRATGETANLGIEQQGEVLFLAQVETHEAIRAFFPPGTKAPMHSSGIGKALLAWASEPRLAAVVSAGLPRFTRYTLTAAQALADDLAATRARGYAVDDQERTEGMRCVAAPVFDAGGKAVAGLSVSGPSFRVGLEATERIGVLVRQAADALTRALGGLPKAD